jgi:hypothetical protein
MKRVQRLIDRAPGGVRGQPFGLGRGGLGAPTPSPVHGPDGSRANGRGECPCRADRCRLERRSVVDQKGFQGLSEVVDEVKPIHHLHGLGCPPANAVGVELAPITTDDGDRRMLGPPGREGDGRAVRPEVDDARGRQIDHKGALAMTPPPGPLVDADLL